MDASDPPPGAALIPRPWQRQTVLALGYLISWMAFWYIAAFFNRLAGVDLWAPCAGLTFALLLERGIRALPLPLFAALLASWPPGSTEPWPYSLAIPMGLLPGCLAAALLRHHAHGMRPGSWRFDDPRRVAGLLGAALCGALFSALAAAPLSQAAGRSPPDLSWMESVGCNAVSHFLGMVTLTPLLLLLVAPAARRWERGHSAPPLEPLRLASPVWQSGLSLAVLGVLWWMSQRLDQPYPWAALLLLPILIWIAATHGARGVALALLVYQLAVVGLVISADLPYLLTAQYQIIMAVSAASAVLAGAVSQARLAERARFRDLTEVCNDWLWEFDEQGRLRNLHGHFSRTVAAFPEHLGRGWREYVAQQQPEGQFAALCAAVQAQRRFQQVTLRLRLPGCQEPVWTRNSGLPWFDDGGGFRGYRGATTDISDAQQAEAQCQRLENLLQDFERNQEAEIEARVMERTRQLAEVSLRNWQLANFDSLTGLPNRNLLFEHLRKSLQQARRQERIVALLLVDLDGFKEVNDTFGHAQGDALLRQVAERLRQCIRATDTAARLGGDEFTIVLTDLEQAEAAEAVAHKLVASLASPVDLGEVTVTVTASVGIALYHPEWPASMEVGMTLLRHADAAMYQAKRAGKNAWRVAGWPGLASD